MTIESTRVIVPEQEDCFTVRSDEPHSLSTIHDDSPADCSMTVPTKTSDSSSTPLHGFSIRSFPDQVGVPLLLLLRYSSTIWLTDLVTTSFTTQSAQHTTVRLKNSDF